jgi:hypothetical protein
MVPVNEGQRQAVVGLQGGLNIIHGLPGTGKSTTIFHIIDARVKKGKQARPPRLQAEGLPAACTHVRNL